MVVTQPDATRGILAQMSELLLYGYGECVQSLPVCAALVVAPAKRLRIPILGRREEADITIANGADLGTIDRPHDVRSVGVDPAVTLFVPTESGAMWRQQAILAHQPLGICRNASAKVVQARQHQ